MGGRPGKAGELDPQRRKEGEKVVEASQIAKVKGAYLKITVQAYLKTMNYE